MVSYLVFSFSSYILVLRYLKWLTLWTMKNGMSSPNISWRKKVEKKRTTQQKHVFVGLCNADSSAFPQPSPLQDAYYTIFFTIQKRIFVRCQVPFKQLKKIFLKSATLITDLALTKVIRSCFYNKNCNFQSISINQREL